MEVLWLILAVFSLFLGIHQSITLGLSSSYFLLLALLALAMYLLRRYMRKNQQHNNN